MESLRRTVGRMRTGVETLRTPYAMISRPYAVSPRLYGTRSGPYERIHTCTGRFHGRAGCLQGRTDTSRQVRYDVRTGWTGAGSYASSGEWRGDLFRLAASRWRLRG